MALRRVSSFFDELQVKEPDRELISELAQTYAAKSRGMTHPEDLKALGAALVHDQPKQLFEIGTFRGNTSDFCLSLLPNLRIVSIAYVEPALRFFGKKYNNSHKDRQEVGCEVQPSNRNRFQQLYGDSHALSHEQILKRYGEFDFVIIDGDHSADGVKQDTILASNILKRPTGTVCWHDANPKPKYLGVKDYLESDLPVVAIATQATFIGGIAYWHGSPSDLRNQERQALQSEQGAPSNDG